ncbi:hypothetical protein EG68_02384 [Paragonimus skrjabini miyazakii]|uniref:Uncharacterized protein n=1 Tax=Paragonimus skrjabini miyazakii TaxID=59628 RepID=A0A8S9Z0E6_9TREM|nr:hypothetical protein EG68_02384 [Paragonimus skrjabini miyazakii]
MQWDRKKICLIFLKLNLIISILGNLCEPSTAALIGSYETSGNPNELDLIGSENENDLQNLVSKYSQIEQLRRQILEKLRDKLYSSPNAYSTSQTNVKKAHIGNGYDSAGSFAFLRG